MRPLALSVILLLFSACPLPAGSEAELLDAIKARMQGAKSYTADMKINVDISFLQAPDATAKIWFKAPDKTHIEAPGFAMIPKQGADMSALRILSEAYVSIDAGMVEFHGTMMRKVRIIPVDESSDIAVATIWIDTTLMLPRKVVSTTKSGGTFSAELVYSNEKARRFGLPSYVKLQFDLGKFELPKSMTGDFDDNETSSSSKAIVQIWYSNYRINVPIKDSIFN